MSSVSTTRHISTNCCQSRLLRAKRETSRAATAPTQTHFGDHALEAGTRSAVGRGAAQIIVDHFDIGPAKPAEALAHGVLQRLTLPIMRHLI